MINSGSNSSTLSYGAFRNRYKQVAVIAGVTETTLYVGGILERMTTGSVTEYRHLIGGGRGVAAIYTRRTAGSPLTDTYYVHADHLGSPELISNAAGAQLVKLSFGAWGERRGSNWTGTPSSGDWTAIGNTTRHGFTWHEHLDSVGLIHMNGRVYDPVVARFLSRDLYVDGWDSTQGTNGYAYVHNNPASYTDPSGFEADEDTIPRHRDEGGGGDPRLWHGWTDWAILEAQVIYGLQTHSIGMTIDVCPDGGFECQPGTTTSSPWSTPTVDLAWTWRETRSPFSPIGFDRQPGGPNGRDNPPNVDSPPQQDEQPQGQQLPCIDDPPIEPVYPELLLIGTERLLYAGMAKTIPFIARALPESPMAQAAYASAARNSLKDLFRFPFNKLFPASKPFGEIAEKYAYNADEIINAAARTDTGYNAAGAASALAGTQGLAVGCARKQ